MVGQWVDGQQCELVVRPERVSAGVAGGMQGGLEMEIDHQEFGGCQEGICAMIQTCLVLDEQVGRVGLEGWWNHVVGAKEVLVACHGWEEEADDPCDFEVGGNPVWEV